MVLCLVTGLLILTIEPMPASAKLPAFCQGDHVPDEFIGKVALVSRSATVVPGGYVDIRLFNGMGRRVGLGNKYLEQRYIGGRWRPRHQPCQTLRLSQRTLRLLGGWFQLDRPVRAFVSMSTLNSRPVGTVSSVTFTWTWALDRNQASA